jgi:sugar phosphate isomerase/epimerase
MGLVGLQLYTIGKESREDLLGTVRNVAAMGYDGVEFAGYHGIELTEIRKVLDGTGLKAAGTHFGLKALDQDYQKIVDDAKVIGIPVIGVPLLPRSEFETEDACNRTAEKLNQAGQKLKESGLKFMYHIHGGEFPPVGSTTGLERVIELTDPALVWLELDTYWVEKDGIDAVEFYKKVGERVFTVHFKDLVSKTDLRDTEVGTGYIDFPSIIKEAKTCPTEWFVVEQEDWDQRPTEEAISPMQSVEVSLKNIREMMEEAG